MATEPVSLLGGKSVHCINELQMEEALRLAEKDPESAAKIQPLLEQAEASLTRNERAALAFVIIQRLKSSAPFQP